MKSIVLLYPPLAKNCEPPPGIARLAGFLRANGVVCPTIDANRLGLDFLLGLDIDRSDTWTTRAVKNLTNNVQALQSSQLYSNFDRYKRAVADINRVLVKAGKQHGLELSLSNYQDNSSPLQTNTLIRVAEEYQDNIFFPFFRDSIQPLITGAQPDFIGISLTYLSQALPAFALIGWLRASFPNLGIILGGGLVTSWMRSPNWGQRKENQHNPFGGLVDFSIAGPGEQPLLALLQGEQQNKGKNRTITAPPVYDQTNYLAPGFILPYAASSGCYWNKCLFCPETAEDNPYLPLAPEQVSAELKILLKRQPTRLIHFLDNAVSPAVMKELVSHPPGVPWYGFARASQLLADEQFCCDLRRSGCVMLKLGLESGDQQVLDQMNKGIELAMVSRVLRSLQAAGILTYVYLLFGTPSEDESSASHTLEFTASHHQAIGFLNLAIFNLPLAGPEAASLAVNEFYQSDLSLYTDFIHPRGWSRQKIRAFLNKKFKRHPAISPIIQRDPPLFTSNHAPLFHPACFPIQK
jgi:hypothetical protein